MSSCPDFNSIIITSELDCCLALYYYYSKYFQLASLFPTPLTFNDYAGKKKCAVHFGIHLIFCRKGSWKSVSLNFSFVLLSLFCAHIFGCFSFFLSFFLLFFTVVLDLLRELQVLSWNVGSIKLCRHFFLSIHLKNVSYNFYFHSIYEVEFLQHTHLGKLAYQQYIYIYIYIWEDKDRCNKFVGMVTEFFWNCQLKEAKTRK